MSKQTDLLNLTDAITVDSSNNVGIGTSSLTTGKLVVNSTQTSTNKQLVLRDSTNGWTRKIGVDTSNNLGFFDGDTERMRIDGSGRVTMPYQPAFSATGGGGNVTISYPTALSLTSTHFNRGNHYNTSTSKFTAPVAGVYQLNLVTYMNSDVANVVFLVNDVQIGSSDPDNLLYKTSSTPYTMAMSICANLSSNDTVSVSSRSGSGATTFYIGHTTFSGFLIG